MKDIPKKPLSFGLFATKPHRLSTLKKMDRIVIIDDGKISEDGSPSALLEKNNGIFKAMWEHQVKGFILDEQEE